MLLPEPWVSLVSLDAAATAHCSHPLETGRERPRSRGEEAGLRWFPLTLELLQSTLAGAKSEGAVVEYSRDDPHADPPKPVELIYKIIMSYHMPIKLLKDPPFPVP